MISDPLLKKGLLIKEDLGWRVSALLCAFVRSMYGIFGIEVVGCVYMGRMWTFLQLPNNRIASFGKK